MLPHLPNGTNSVASIAAVTLLTIAVPIARAETDSPRLSNAACDRLTDAATARDLRAALDELGIVPQEQRISGTLTTLQWTGGSAFFSSTLRGNAIESTSCQSEPGLDPATPDGEAHVLCSRIDMGMDLLAVQQTLESAGEELVTEDGLSLGVWQWEDAKTGQVALVSFNNFGEMAGLSCLAPVPIVDVVDGAASGTADANADPDAIESEAMSGEDRGDR